MIRDGSRYDLGMACSEFDRRLEAIEAKVIELFGMVAEDLPTVAGRAWTFRLSRTIRPART